MTKELVICRYRENLSWLEAVPIPIKVYNKGDNYHKAPFRAKVVSEKNVGREAQVILTHIVNCWDQLADLTFFAQGHVHDHTSHFIERLRPIYYFPSTLSERHCLHISPPRLSGFMHGFRVAYGNAKDFSGGGPVVRAWIRATWENIFTCEMPEDFMFGFGAFWVVPKSYIQSRPLEFWRYWLNDIETTRSGENHWNWCAHYMNAWSWELIWKYVFEGSSAYPHKEPWT